MGPVEAWGARTRRGFGFIKGCFQPLPLLFYTPRLVGPRKTWSLEAPGDEAVVAEETPCLGGRRVPLLDPRRAELVSPLEALRALRGCGTALCRAALALAEELASTGALVGATGGLMYSPGSAGDIDLVVYGPRGAEAYRVLAELRERGATRPLPGPGHGWSRRDAELHEALRGARLLQGVYMGFEYNVRIVACTEPQPCRPRRLLGRLRVSGVVIEASPFTTPALYLLEASGPAAGSTRLFLETYRLRYTEIPPGSLVEAEGVLEEQEGRLTLVPDHGGYVALKAPGPRPG